MMKQYLYKVRGDYSPIDLQKVVNEDKKLIQMIAEDIWKIVDCAVYYHEVIRIDAEVDIIRILVK